MTTTTNTYVINSECGLMTEFQAADIDAAKAIYAREHHFDFDDLPEGSWYWIDENGQRVEEQTADQPKNYA